MLIKIKKTLLFLLLIVKITSAQQNTLSNQAEISVLTIGQGNSLNDAFGHSAFRIKDTTNNIDLVYGYGEYDFNSPNFYLKFAQGKLNYLISKHSFSRFYQIYTYYNRTVKEQTLNISKNEKQILYDYLINNYKPQNRAYLYEFFFDNCATKIKDVANIALNNTIKYNTPSGLEIKTFRKLIHSKVNQNSWGSLGIDIALGSVIDRKATIEEHMFLPENIFKFFEAATINNKPLVKKTSTLYTKRNTKTTDSFFTSPLFILSLVSFFIIFITFKNYKNNNQSKWLDISLFGLSGILGMLILFLWFGTDHKGTHQNYNLLWACVLNIFAIRQFFKKNPSAWFIRYLKLLVIFMCLLSLHWIIGVQTFAISLTPLLVALLIRYLYLIKFYTKQ